MLTELKIDPLGVSTDSLMLIISPDNLKEIVNVLEKVTPVYKAGHIEKGSGAVLVNDDGVELELQPLFRESPYTKVKGVVGEERPHDLFEKSQALQGAKEQALSKKRAVKEWLTKA
jgi:hydrogenase expression/formation protein